MLIVGVYMLSLRVLLHLLPLQSYEGDWVNGERHGTGTYTYRAAEGMVYTGQWHR
jgi:hypothetical protein